MGHTLEYTVVLFISLVMAGLMLTILIPGANIQTVIEAIICIAGIAIKGTVAIGIAILEMKLYRRVVGNITSK